VVWLPATPEHARKPGRRNGIAARTKEPHRSGKSAPTVSGAFPNGSLQSVSDIRQRSSAVAVIESVLGSADIPEVSMTSSTAPGVIHRWTNLGAFAEEVANARIWAGFHYRFSTRVGTDMGRRFGEYVLKNVMQPR
jgi:hypothetical protein